MRRPALWIMFFALLACFFGWETYNAWTAAPAPAPAPAAGPALAPRPSDGAADNVSRSAELGSQIAVIVTRPLFRQDRQPFVENAAVAQVQRPYEAELSKFTLIGVVLEGDSRKGVVLGSAAGRHDRWEVCAGDSLPGFYVRDVQPDGLTLVADGKEFQLPLYAGAPKGQAATSGRTEVGAPAAPGIAAPGAAPAGVVPGAPPGTLPGPIRSQVPGIQPPAAPSPGVLPYGGRVPPNRPPRNIPRVGR